MFIKKQKYGKIKFGDNMKKVLFLIPLLFLTTSCKKTTYSSDLEYELKADDTYRVSLKAGSKEKDITIPKKYKDKSVSEITGFRNNDYIENVKFFGNITKVDDGTFTYCKNLKSITVSDSKYYSSSNGNLYQNKALLIYASGNENKEVTVKENILSKAFTLAPNIEEITLNSKTIEDNSIYYLENIKAITITDKVETISSNFYGGKTLEKLYIKNVEIASKMDIKNTEKIYVLKGQTLSSKTLENYSLSSSDSIYDIYEVK